MPKQHAIIDSMRHAHWLVVLYSIPKGAGRLAPSERERFNDVLRAIAENEGDTLLILGDRDADDAPYQATELVNRAFRPGDTTLALLVVGDGGSWAHLRALLGADVIWVTNLEAFLESEGLEGDVLQWLIHHSIVTC